MATVASIEVYLANIMAAVYGEEVRSSIHDAIQSMWNDLDYAVRNQLIDVDSSLSQSGSGAEAAAVGARLDAIDDTLQNVAFLKRGDPVTGTNLNSLTSIGYYRLLQSNAPFSNLPTDSLLSPAILLVFVAGSYIFQIFYNYSGSPNLAQQNYVRRYDADRQTWSSWISNLDTTLSVEGKAADAAAVGLAIQNATLELDSTLSLTGKAADASAVGAALERLEDIINYIPIDLTSVSISPEVAEKGSVLTSVTVSYICNKTPSSLTINDIEYTPKTSDNVVISNLAVRANRTFTVSVSDLGSPSSTPKTESKNVTVHFYNRCYWGIARNNGPIDSDFVKRLSDKPISDSKKRSFTVEAGSPGDGWYIWYAYPKRLGTCTFAVGGFEGGFEQPLEVLVENDSEFAEDYYVYRSTYDGLGSVYVVVS